MPITDGCGVSHLLSPSEQGPEAPGTCCHQMVGTKQLFNKHVGKSTLWRDREERDKEEEKEIQKETEKAGRAEREGEREASKERERADHR